MILSEHNTGEPPERFGTMIEVGASRLWCVCLYPNRRCAWVSVYKIHTFDSEEVARLGWRLLQNGYGA